MEYSVRRMGNASLLAILVPLTLSFHGCGDWPHFDYEASPLAVFSELESEDGEHVQNMKVLNGDIIATGQIESSRYVEGADNSYGLSGWYGGDMDWFQFSVRDGTDASLELSWDAPDASLDLYFFIASADTGQIDTLLVYENTREPSPKHLEVTGLLPETIYVFAVAGYMGDNVDYELYLEFDQGSP